MKRMLHFAMLSITLAGAPLGSAVALDAPATAANAAAGAAATPAGTAHAWARREVGYLRTADGVLLRYSVLLPKASGRFPVIINYSGYDPGAIGGAAYDSDDTAMSRYLDRTLLEHGYAVMGVNARGTGCSEGEFDFLGPKYGEDGRDAVEFAAAQPWSTGAVGMANWSWAGMSQLATASNRPRHLKAIAPGMVLGDARLDSWAPGGVPAPGFITLWRIFLHQRWDSIRASAEAEGDQRCIARIAANLEGEERNAITHQVARHPLRDDWINTRALNRRSHLIQVPVLSMEAFQDEAVTSRQGYYQETLDPSRVWLVQSNGGHDLYEALRFRVTLIAFLDHFVKGIDNGFEKHPHLEVWMDSTSSGKGFHDAEEHSEPAWVVQRPALAVAPKPVFWSLAEGGRLAEAPLGAPDAYNYPVPGVAVDVDMDKDAWGELPRDWKDGSRAYTSAALDHDLFAYGSASADLYLSAALSDADVQVTLTEVTAEGQEIFVQRGWLRLSDRATNPAKATVLRPELIDTPESIRTLTPDQPVLARVELNKFGYVFRKGSRIRIWIDAPSAWGGYLFSPISTPQAIKVWHDAEHPSRLALGSLDDVTIPAGKPSCNRLKEPCRPDPLAVK